MRPPSGARSCYGGFDDAIGIGFSAENPHAFPTSAVSIFIGVVAGRALVAGGRLMILRLAALAAGSGLAGALLMIIVPLNKNLWTPSYVLLTSGIAIALLIVCYVIVDHFNIVWPFQPLLHIGSNAIVAFCLVGDPLPGDPRALARADRQLGWIVVVDDLGDLPVSDQLTNRHLGYLLSVVPPRNHRSNLTLVRP
ncbi:MAG: hypothetical protein ABI137_11040 [Antricoccus sp.]